MTIVYSRRRHLTKKRLAHTGRGLFLGALLELSVTLVLPWVLKSQPEPIVQMTFSDLLKIEADQPPQITDATFFTIDIPKIGAQSRVIPNVNSADKFEYGQALSRGVAHAAGTFLPGMDGSVTLFAHSTDFSANVERYNAVFYRLDELNPGDTLTVWYLGKKYDYRVVKTRVTSPTDTEVFKSQTGPAKLYLVTCTPRGTTKNRLIVEAKIL